MPSVVCIESLTFCKNVWQNFQDRLFICVCTLIYDKNWSMKVHEITMYVEQQLTSFVTFLKIHPTPNQIRPNSSLKCQLSVKFQPSNQDQYLCAITFYLHDTRKRTKPSVCTQIFMYMMNTKPQLFTTKEIIQKLLFSVCQTLKLNSSLCQCNEQRFRQVFCTV